MRLNIRLIPVLFIVAALPGLAVVKVKVPLPGIYRSAETVAIGQVQSQDGTLLNVSVTPLKGRTPQELKVHFTRHWLIAKTARKGTSVVLFQNERRNKRAESLLHVADTWFVASPVDGGWTVKERYVDGKTSFPGRTAALVQLVDDIAADRPNILNASNRTYLDGKLQNVGELPLQHPRWAIARDVTGDDEIDLLIGTKETVMLFAKAKDGYEKTASIPVADSPYHASNDRDLLIGGAVWAVNKTSFVKQRTSFRLPTGPPLVAAFDGKDVVHLTRTGEQRRNQGVLRLWPATSPASNAVIGNFGGDKKQYVLVVRESGITRYGLDGKAPSADFERLTGVHLQRYYERYRKGLGSPRVLKLDVNGDQRDDALVVCETGGLLLINRGYGAFLVDYKAAGAIAPRKRDGKAFCLRKDMAWAAADVDGDGSDDLVILTAKGELLTLPARSK